MYDVYNNMFTKNVCCSTIKPWKKMSVGASILSLIVIIKICQFVSESKELVMGFVICIITKKYNYQKYSYFRSLWQKIQYYMPLLKCAVVWDNEISKK